MTETPTDKGALAPEAVPYLPRGVRLADDRVRKMRVLLGPERALQLDPIGEAILSAVDGTRSVAEIASDLGARFGAPVAQVQTDTGLFLGDLVDRRLVFVR